MQRESRKGDGTVRGEGLRGHERRQRWMRDREVPQETRQARPLQYIKCGSPSLRAPAGATYSCHGLVVTSHDPAVLPYSRRCRIPAKKPRRGKFCGGFMRAVGKPEILIFGRHRSTGRSSPVDWAFPRRLTRWDKSRCRWCAGFFSYHDLLPLPMLFCHGSVLHASIDGAFGRDVRLSTLPPCGIHT
jgi:hypothetical protein